MAELIDRLEGWVNEPYRQDRVLKAARSIPQPFRLSEVRRESGLPLHKVQKCLDRLVKKGILTRRKVPMTFDALTGGQGGGPVRWIPGGRTWRIYLYSFTEAGAE